MSWEQMQGKWTELKGRARERWGRLTEDELDIINGKRDVLIGKLQQHYGYTKDRAEEEAERFMHDCNAPGAGRCSP